MPGVPVKPHGEPGSSSFEDPSAWKVFIKYQDRVTRSEFAKASRFRARLQLVVGFRDLPLAQVSAATAESYFVLMKLSLAYTTLEALESLLGKKSVRVTDKVFHSALSQGQFDALLKHFIEAAKEQPRPTDAELTGFLSASMTQDLTPIVKHSRHAVFHASATPNSLKLQGSPERRRLLLGLANSTIEACDKAFSRYVATMKQRPKGKSAVVG